MEKQGASYIDWQTDTKEQMIEKLKKEKLVKDEEIDSDNKVITIGQEKISYDPEAIYTVTYAFGNSSGVITGDLPKDTKQYKKGETVTLQPNIGSQQVTIGNGSTVPIFEGWSQNSDLVQGRSSIIQGNTFSMPDHNVILYGIYTWPI